MAQKQHGYTHTGICKVNRENGVIAQMKRKGFCLQQAQPHH
jgi:hypothetical protein